MNEIIIRPSCMWLWIRAMRSGYVPDNRAMAIARNSFFFRIWGLVTETQLDQIANILIHQEIKEETKLEGVYGKANQPHHAIDLHLDEGYWKITLDPHWENL